MMDRFNLICGVMLTILFQRSALNKQKAFKTKESALFVFLNAVTLVWLVMKTVKFRSSIYKVEMIEVCFSLREKKASTQKK